MFDDHVVFDVNAFDLPPVAGAGSIRPLPLLGGDAFEPYSTGVLQQQWPIGFHFRGQPECTGASRMD